MKDLIARVTRFVADQDGITAIEYGLLAGLISLAIIGAVQLLSGSISSVFTNLASSI
ncbi:Flp family type IVb pilin [Paraburkholderia sp. BR14374]|uniref:Flp family type IVb pilin n=1 Tax=Paraburkholderia sp. BR14374 TaxID=3237007 RepID=UPI0034CD9A76